MKMATLEQYVDAIHRHRRALELADSDAANRIYAELMDIVTSIKESPNGLLALKPLLDSEEDDVRSTAAAHLLGTCEKDALAVLKEVAQRSGLSSFEARMTLREWGAGRMQPP